MAGLKATPAPDEKKDPTAVSVRLTQRDAPWNAGDVVELPARAAAKLVRHGVAELVVERVSERRTARARRH